MSRRSPLSDTQVAAVRSSYPGLPEEYLRYLRKIGWGQAKSGRVIYQGPVSPEDIYGTRFRDSSIMLLGDDTQGYCLGFDRSASRLGEMSNSGVWEPWPDGESFADYVGDQHE